MPEPKPYKLASEHVHVQRCAFGDDQHGYCGEPAVEHILVNDADDQSTACDTHRTWFETNPCKDRHPITGPCALPGTRWIYTTEDSPGWCEFEGISGLETALAEAELHELETAS
jgi:hypothetical protein